LTLIGGGNAAHARSLRNIYGGIAATFAWQHRRCFVYVGIAVTFAWRHRRCFVAFLAALPLFEHHCCFRSALEKADGTPLFAVVSKTQAAALRAASTEAKPTLTADESASVVLELGSLNWQHTAHAEFATGPFGLEDEQDRKRARRVVQDWLALPAYFTDELWSFMLSKSNSQSAKLDAMLTFALRGGLRLPSEATSKIMPSSWLILAEPDSSLLMGIVQLQSACNGDR